ncbi:MAG: tRNA 2-thiocytidine biosynthesis TtcA family protein [Mycoplasmoidaceae bacterium]
MKSLVGSIIKTNKLFNIIENNDRICVGVSGGKDSMLLLETLSQYKRIVKKYLDWDIEIFGVHLQTNLCAINYEEITNYWKKKNIKFSVVSTKMGEILKNQLKKGKIQCSLCSKMKKAILIDEAKKLNCNKVAMGHHADDAIETFFMNMINEGRLATFKPKMFLDRSNIWFIRPFILTREKDIIKIVKLLKLPIIPCGCPMEGFTQRDSIKDFLKENFYENKKWNASYKNFLGMLLNKEQYDLWFDKNKEINHPELLILREENGKF